MPEPVSETFSCKLPSGTHQESTLYTFANVGDEIPLHDHTYWHNCIVISGAVEVFDETKSVVVSRGKFVEFPAGRKHGIRATEPSTITLHTSEPGIIR